MGAVGGLVGMIGGLGGFVLPIVFGALLDWTGVYTSCFAFLFVLVAVMLAWMHLSIRAMERAAEGAVLDELPTVPELQAVHVPGRTVMPREIQDWRPEDPEFWAATGRKIAQRNLWISIPALLLAFAVWMVWSMVVARLPAIGFAFTPDQLYLLTALPALSGATLRIFYGFMVPIFGGRLWTTLSTASLLIPAIALGGTLMTKYTTLGPQLIDPAQATLISLIVGALAAVVIAMIWLRPPLLAPLQEGRRLLDAVGWAAILPQMLASLGAVFLAAGVGDQVGNLFKEHFPLDTRTFAVIAYCVGMALFTILMGNAFAAFPVMTAAVGLPFVVVQLGGDPARVCAIGMLAGFCGTLVTPMAANFNVVPAALLELKDQYGPIKAQLPTAVALLGCNIAIMYLFAV